MPLRGVSEVTTVSLRTFVIVLALILVAAIVSGALLVGWALGKLREKRLRVPPGADFFTTVRAVPLPLLVGIDLLDLGLDVFSAPIIWFILNRLKLQKLRNVATIEALIPFSAPIPTLTIAWILARFFGFGRPHDPNVIETEQVAPGRYEARPVRPAGAPR
jgi:hypothetical protein